MTKTTIFTLPVHVYVEDTDFGGIVYHAKYLHFMERSRTSWLNHMGLPLRQLVQEGFLFAVRSAQIEYLRPARINDELIVSSRITHMGKSSLHFAHTITDAIEKDCVYCTGDVKIVCVNQDLRPLRVPEKLRELTTHD